MNNGKIVNVDDYQNFARLKLPKPLYEYLASGTDDEQTLAENDSAFKDWYLRPRVMRPVGGITTKTKLFGQTLSLPVFISPAGVHALCDPHGECATARAAGEAGTLFRRGSRDPVRVVPARHPFHRGGGEGSPALQPMVPELHPQGPRDDTQSRPKGQGVRLSGNLPHRRLGQVRFPRGRRP